MVEDRRTHYEVLQVPRQASRDEIKTAFRRLAKMYHPDFTPGMDGTRFRRICEAYKVLSNPPQRRAYDRRLRESAKEDRPVYGWQFAYAHAR